MTRLTLAMVAVLSAAWCCAASGAEGGITYESLLREMIDRDAIARFPDPACTCRQASSYDREAVSPEKDTWFANADRKQFIRVEENGGRKEWVLMDAAGPGAVVRFWSANPDQGGVVRFYLDGAEQPALETPLSDLLGGTWRVGRPLSAVRARGWNLYLPIPYARACKVTTDKDDIYYQINYRTYAPGTAVETFSMDVFTRGLPVLREVTRTLSTVGRDLRPRPMRTLGKTGRLTPGQAARLLLSPGPHAVRELTVRLQADDVENAYRNTVLRMEFDGQETVWCPVGDFFGSGVGVNLFRSWWQRVEADGSMTCYWPMPYERSATIVLENLGDVPVEFAATARMGDWNWCDRSMHFHATWRHEYPISTEKKHDWNYVEIKGKGVYAGDALALVNPTTVWWGEGDEKIYVDGESFPSHFGTGTEDYYGYAWGDSHFFEAPFHAQSRVDGPVVFGHTALLRTRSLDAIPFNRSLKFDIEVWHWRAVQVAYAATTYFYARPPATHNRLADRTKTAPGVAPLESVRRVAGAVEVEAMEIVSVPPDAAWRIEANWRNAAWSGDAQMWFGCKGKGEAVELRYPEPVKGPQKVTIHASRYPDYGIIQVFAGGNPVGKPIDLCNTEDKALVATGPIALGTFEPGPGCPIFRFEVVGSNPKAVEPGTYFGIDCIVLAPVEADTE
ncbi:MAG: DUF2961 domain-containing protein [Phycisphaerales bacterium]|nr:MAG: DUF2961 domain-containing protein [Phycisphaerales bacterium]